ncbi:hypothetical protein B9Z55_027438 [Caenorhabditis nigoni]|nr:hypothetical protein B9Z55_027438 [Caenorhabditis nigoni]
MSCRFSNFGDVQPEVFDSASCASCFLYIYMIVDHYNDRYHAKLCEDGSGILVCPGKNPDLRYCHCQDPSLVYNLPEFAYNS